MAYLTATFLVFALVCGFAVSGQDQQDQPIVRISVDLVQIEAMVTDSKGNHVTDLRPEDFEILEDGKRQKIDRCTYIQTGTANLERPQDGEKSNSSGPPRSPALELAPEQVKRTIVFLIDDDSFAPEVVPAVRKAMRTMIEQKMEPGDLVAVLRTTSGTGALDRFTSDKNLLLASVDRIRWHPGGRGSPHMDDSSALYLRSLSFQKTFGALRFVISALRNLPGRKAIIFVSQSWLADSGPSVESARWRMPIATPTGTLIDEAIRSAATIYTIDPTALDSLNPGADYDITQDYIRRFGTGSGSIDPAAANQLLLGFRANGASLLELKRAGLRGLADGTGGLMIADTNDPAWGMTRFLDDLQGYYQIEFKPSDPARFFGADSKSPPPFHRLRVRVSRKGDRVRYHAGFIGRQASAEAVGATVDPFERAMSSPFSAFGIPLRLTAIFNARALDAAEIDVLLNIDARSIRFTRTTGGHESGVLELVARSTDEGGVPAESVKKDIKVNFTDAQFQEAKAMGLLYQASIPVRHPGYYEVRIAVRDSTGKLGSARQYVNVPDLRKRKLAMSGLLVFASGSHRRDPLAPAVAALRTFHRADTLTYICQIFNSESQIQIDARILHDGKQVPAAPGQVASARIVNSGAALTASGTVQLSSLEPGDYVLQLVISDETGKSQTSQWTDFEVVR